MSDLLQFQNSLGYQFQNRDLLGLALTHPSALVDPHPSAQHNQRLEFLGDAVLQLILTQELYQRFPGWGEGEMTKARSRLVNHQCLAEQGHRLRLGEHLRLGRGEEKHGGRQRASSLADAFEAVLGALFIDGGYDAAGRFVRQLFASELEQLDKTPDEDNPKGELQELLQATSSHTPLYRLEHASGPDHERMFECAVLHEGIELGRGTGRSKKEAESRAALVALDRLRLASPAAPDASAAQ